MLLLPQYGRVPVNMCKLEFYHIKTFNFYDESEGDKHLKYVLDLRPFVVNKLPDDGTLVPKHVGVDT